MEGKEAAAGSSLDSLIASFNTRIAELQQLVIARNMYPASGVVDLSAIDSALKTMELQVHKIKDRLGEEAQAIPKAKRLIEASLRQQKKLQEMSAYVPSYLPERTAVTTHDSKNWPPQEPCKEDPSVEPLKHEEPPALKCELQVFLADMGERDAQKLWKEKKGRASAPLWYITMEELNSLPQYMKGRLTLDKVNAAINDMAAYADANSQLVTAPRKKLTENTLERALELREIAMSESVKGKHFFLETDMKGPVLKFDTTGKGILTVLRHLGRICENRIGHHRVIILQRPQ